MVMPMVQVGQMLVVVLLRMMFVPVGMVYPGSQPIMPVIVMEYEEKDYGGAGYGARDLEGNVWSFGSYDPFA